MNQDNYYEIEHGEIESSVLVLGAAYAASLLGMIYWVITWSDIALRKTSDLQRQPQE